MSRLKETRVNILRSASKLFAEKGYHETSMDSIVEESGTSKGTLYYHFDSKEQLFKEMFKRAVSEVFAEISQVVRDDDLDVQTKLYKITLANTRFCLESADIAQSIFLQGGTSDSEFHREIWQWKQAFHQEIKKVMKAGVESGYLVDRDQDLLAHVFLGILQSYGQGALQVDQDPAQLADFTLELFLQGAKK
ncbi:MAG: TetR/AcrR family transcriptional regulator [Bacillota bacterium]